MKARNREVNIFNMSVLDLLIGALGAFCFLTLALFPSYFKAQGTESAASSAAVARLEEVSAKLKNEFAAVKGKQTGIPAFAMANAGAGDPQGNSCGDFRVTDATGPGGKQAIKMLSVNLRNGFSTGANFFLLAPGTYQVAFEARADRTPCKLFLAETLAKGYRTASTDLKTTLASYTLPISVMSEDLSFATPANQ